MQPCKAVILQLKINNQKNVPFKKYIIEDADKKEVHSHNLLYQQITRAKIVGNVKAFGIIRAYSRASLVAQW